MTVRTESADLTLARDAYEGTVAYLSDLKVDLDELYDQTQALRLKVMAEIDEHVFLSKCPSFTAYTVLETQFKDLSRFIFDAYLNLNRFVKETVEAHDLSIKV